MENRKKGPMRLLVALGVWVLLTSWPAQGQGLRMSPQPVRVFPGKEIYTIAFSPDSRYMAVSGGGILARESIAVFETSSGGMACELRGHGEAITSLVFSPDGKRIISGSKDHTIRVWDASSGGQVGQILAGHEIFGVACSGNGSLIAAGGKGGAVTVWDADTFAGKGQLQQHAEDILCIAMSPDGRLVASGSDDETVIIWNLEQRAVAKMLPAGGSEVTAVAFSPDNSRFAAGTEDQMVMQWMLPDFSGPVMMAGHSNDVLSVAYSSDGRYLASGSRDRTVIVWDAQTGQMAHRRDVANDPWSLAFSPDGKFLAVGTNDKGVLLFGLEGVGPEVIFAQKSVGPSIELLQPETRQLSTSGPRIVVTGLVSDPEGITRVSVNGLDARLAEPTPEEIEKFGQEHKVYRFIGEALLVLGENRIQIMAMDAKGNVNEKMIVVNRLVGTVDADGTERLTHTSTIARTEPIGPKLKIAVLDLDAQGVTAVMAQVLSESLRTELYNSGRFRVMNREDVDKVLKEKAFEMTAAFQSNDKIAEMGTALGVEKMVAGSIGILGRTYSVTLRVIDVASHENERIVTERYNGLEDGLFATVEATARKLVAGY